jgi:hypothetical protein
MARDGHATWWAPPVALQSSRSREEVPTARPYHPGYLYHPASQGSSSEVSFCSLWLARPNREIRRLTPLTADGLFAVDGTGVLRVRFRENGLEAVRLGETEPRVFEKR